MKQFSLILTLSILLWVFSLSAADDIRVQSNTGKVYVVPSATPTEFAPVMIGYTTDGNSHLQILGPGGGSVDDNLAFPQNTGKMYLDKGGGNLYPATVLYTTDGNNNIQPISLSGGVDHFNGQTGSAQVFANDTNLTITSSNNTHSLGWTGTLSVGRGGIGLSTVSAGQIPFGAGTSPLATDSNLAWDNNNKILGSDNVEFQGQFFGTAGARDVFGFANNADQIKIAAADGQVTLGITDGSSQKPTSGSYATVVGDSGTNAHVFSVIDKNYSDIAPIFFIDNLNYNGAVLNTDLTTGAITVNGNVTAVAFIPSESIQTVTNGFRITCTDSARLTSASDVTGDAVTPFANGQGGQHCGFENVGSHTITIKNTGNWISPTGADYVLQPGKTLSLIFNSTNNTWGAEATTAQGVICGWYDSVAPALITSCMTHNPNVDCPAGYTQKTTTGAKFCAAN